MWRLSEVLALDGESIRECFSCRTQDEWSRVVCAIAEQRMLGPWMRGRLQDWQVVAWAEGGITRLGVPRSQSNGMLRVQELEREVDAGLCKPFLSGRGRVAGCVQSIVWRRELHVMAEHREIPEQWVQQVEWVRREGPDVDRHVVWYALDAADSGLYEEVYHQQEGEDDHPHSWEWQAAVRIRREWDPGLREPRLFY